MMGFLLLAGAGAAFFFGTEKGRAMMGQARQTIQDGYAKMSEAITRQGGVEGMIRDAVTSDHPDTAMAGAFEEVAAAV